MAGSEQSKMASAALRHPIRVRLLEALHLHGEVSATLFVNEGWGKDLTALKGKTHQQQISDVSYHLRELDKANCVRLTRAEKRRGALEKFYAANAVAYFSDEEWAALPLSQRREITRVVAQSLIVQVEGAILADTFDSRDDRWLLWEPMKLDEAGWSQMSAAILGFYAEVSKIRDAAGERLEATQRQADGASVRGDEVEAPPSPIWATFGVELFESPRWSDPPQRDALDSR